MGGAGSKNLALVPVLPGTLSAEELAEAAESEGLPSVVSTTIREHEIDGRTALQVRPIWSGQPAGVAMWP